MRRMHRIVLLATLVAFAPAVSGCSNFDPDKLDVFGWNEKKKLAGDRKPVFPEGVPGVNQGIPPQYMKGANPPPGDPSLAGLAEPAAAAPTTAVEQQVAEEPKPAPKPAAKPAVKPKPKRVVKRTPPPAPAQPAAQTQQQQSQPPASASTSSATSPWPAAGQGTAPANNPWPSAPPAGTFTR
jgi:hypothetical protein